MKREKFVFTDLNQLGATHFSTLRDPCLGGDPYLGNRWIRGTSSTFQKSLELSFCALPTRLHYGL